MSQWQYTCASSPSFACDGCQQDRGCWECGGSGEVDVGQGYVGCCCVPCGPRRAAAKVKEAAALLASEAAWREREAARGARPTLTEACVVIRALIDEEPCRLDHEGFCQSHGATRPCAVAEARALLRRLE
jgi:hypothetical protein